MKSCRTIIGLILWVNTYLWYNRSKWYGNHRTSLTFFATLASLPIKWRHSTNQKYIFMYTYVRTFNSPPWTTTACTFLLEWMAEKLHIDMYVHTYVHTYVGTYGTNPSCCGSFTSSGVKIPRSNQWTILGFDWSRTFLYIRTWTYDANHSSNRFGCYWMISCYHYHLHVHVCLYTSYANMVACDKTFRKVCM